MQFYSTLLTSMHHADKQQLIGMAAAFATLPCKVLWRLTPKEIPDAGAIAELKLSNNTRVGMPFVSHRSLVSCICEVLQRTCSSAMQNVHQQLSHASHGRQLGPQQRQL